MGWMLLGYTDFGGDMLISFPALLAAWGSGLFPCVGFEDELVDRNQSRKFALRSGIRAWLVGDTNAIHRVRLLRVLLPPAADGA